MTDETQRTARKLGHAHALELTLEEVIAAIESCSEEDRLRVSHDLVAFDRDRLTSEERYRWRYARLKELGRIPNANG